MSTRRSGTTVRACVGVALAAAFAAPAGADAQVVLTETTHATAGSRAIDGTRTTSIQGARKPSCIAPSVPSAAFPMRST